MRFEEIGKGRLGTVLVKSHASRGTPIVRTTTKYAQPPGRFRAVHEALAESIKTTASLRHNFNNALIEIYDNEYRKMGAHSDQALDLVSDSSIAVFSCYEHPNQSRSRRKLIIESKDSEERFEVPLAHNGVVTFSVHANRRYKHRIVLDAHDDSSENRWLGITFRTSQTYVRASEGRALFEDGTELTLAHEDQRREFYALRGRENRETDFVYPRLGYTISASDLLPPVADFH